MTAPLMTNDPTVALLAELRALRMGVAQLAQLVARPDGGNNPFGYPPRPASVTEFGVGHSGPKRVFTVEDGLSVKHQLLNCVIKEIVPQGYYGMATIHVSSFFGKLIEVAGSPNAMLLGHLEWQSGNAGGSEDIDLTRGAVIPVGGTTSIQLSAELVSNDGAALVPYAEVEAEATVCWETSSAKRPPMTLPAVVLAPNVASAWLPIPRQSDSMIALGTPSTAYPTLIAEFSVADGAGALVRYQVVNPLALPHGAPVRLGCNFVRFVNSAAMSVAPSFNLW